MIASDGPAAIDLVARGETQLAISNPADVSRAGDTRQGALAWLDAIVTSICAALEARKDKIGWQEAGPLPLETMCRDTAEGPLVIPLHPAAERSWRWRGYLD